MRDFEHSDLAEPEKVALRYADKLRWDPSAVDEALLRDLKRHFDDAQICEIGYLMLVYAGAQSFMTSIDLTVYDDDGNDLSGRTDFPLVSTLAGELRFRDDLDD